jgi:hypothetical protein
LEEATEENTLIQERENNLLVKKLLNVELLIYTLNTSLVKMTMHHQAVLKAGNLRSYSRMTLLHGIK